MTIFEASGMLYKWFSENDSFSFKEDYNKLILISEQPEADRVALKCSLETFEEMIILKSKEVEGEKYWVLIKKFSSVEQSLTISAPTALHLHSLVQMYTEVLGLGDQYSCNPLDICETDIKALLSAIELLVSSK